MARIKRDDQVMVIAGKDKGQAGKVMKVLKGGERVIVEKLNMVKRHTRPSQQNPQGGRLEREAAVHISNVALYDEKEQKGTRTRYRVEDGKKIRVSVRSGADLDG